MQERVRDRRRAVRGRAGPPVRLPGGLPLRLPGGLLLVRVRAYAGTSVADREIVGGERERVSLRADATRRLTVTVPTQRPADRVRVIVEPARD